METVAKPIPGYEEFATHVNSLFTAPGGGSQVLEFTLIEAKHLFSDERTESFSLLFQTPSTAPPEQGIFSLLHDQLGTHDLFLVPIRQSEESLFFEANFNLIK